MDFPPSNDFIFGFLFGTFVGGLVLTLAASILALKYKREKEKSPPRPKQEADNRF